jgi:hypothetical protein
MAEGSATNSGHKSTNSFTMESRESETGDMSRVVKMYKMQPVHTYLGNFGQYTDAMRNPTNFGS